MRRFLLNELNTPKPLRLAFVLFTMLLLPSAAWGQAGTYGISIAGTALTSENYNPTTGAVNNMEGVTFDFQNSILTLENVTIESDSPAIESSLESLTINIIGNNNLSSSSSNAIQSDKANATLRISRDGSSSTLMLVPSSSFYAITGFNTSLDGVNAYSTDTYSSISSTNGNLGDNGKAVLICSGTPYGFYVGGTIVTSENKGTVLGSGVDFIPGNESTATLKLSNNATIPGDIEWDLTKDLTIEVYAGNTIQGCIYTFRNTPKLYFTYPSGSTDSNITIGNSEGDNSAIEGFSGIIFPEDNKLKFDENLIYVEQSLRDNENNQKSKLAHISYHYGLSIYKGNNILMDFSTNKSSFSSNDGIDGFSSGSISFDNSERKLTLTGVTIADGIILWDHIGDSETLKIALSGNSTITCETPMTITQEGGTQVTTQIKAPIISRAEVNYWTVYPTPSERENQPYIQFTSADQNERSLILSKKDVDNCIQGFKYIDNSVVDGSVTHTKTTDNIDGGHAYMLITSESYMSLNNILVHGIEDFPTGYKANVTGETNQKNEPLISYDSEENILTLNGVNLTTTSDFIFSNLSDLKINLVGDNTISVANGYVAFKGNKTNAKVTFNTNTTAPGTLAITVPEENLFSSITDLYQDGLSHTYKDGVYTISATSYGLTVAGVEVTSLNCEDILDGENKGKVSFTPATISLDSQTPSTPATLTLNDAVLTAPIIIGLSELTIDIQGTNSITTNTTCIQNQENTTPVQLTFKSTSAEVGSLTLTNTSDNSDGVINDKYFEKFTISNELALIMLRYGGYTSNTYYFTAGEVHNAQIVPSYGVQVESAQILQVYEGNANDILGDGTDTKEPTVSFDKTTNTLTLNNATGISTISTTLSTLNIELVGNNSLFLGSNGSIFDSSSGEALTINLESTGETKGTLTIETESNSSAKFKGDNVTLTSVAPIVLLSGDLTTNSGTLEYGTLSAPTMSSETVDGVSTITLTSTADNSTIKYSIDYVDASQTDITDATYDSSNKPTINQPATVTAKVTLSEVESATTTGKYFGTDPSPFTLISGADPVNFVLAPAIDESDGISITSISGIESNVTYDAGTGKISSSTMGSFNGQVSMSSTDGKTVILNNNFTATFTIQIDISQAVITLDNTELIYNGNEQTVSVQKVMVGDDVVPQDYYEISGNTGTEMGNYTLTVTAKTRDSQGNPFNNIYTGTATKVWKITNHYTATATELGFSTVTQTASTYYSPSENFNLPEGYVGYIITGVEGSKVLTTRISYIPKGVAVLVEKGTSAENPIEEIPDASEQPLKGTSEPLDVTSITGGTVYVLYNGMFVKSTSGTIPAHRCYLLVATNVAAGTRGFTIDHGEGTTALRGVTAEGTHGKSDAWYTLQGLRLPSKPLKPGLYLHNGHKVVIK